MIGTILSGIPDLNRRRMPLILVVTDGYFAVTILRLLHMLLILKSIAEEFAIM